MAETKSPDLDTLKDALDAAESLYGTSKEALAQFLEDVKNGNIADKALAGRIKGLTDKLGVLGDLIGIGLGYAGNGEKGAVPALLGAIAGAVAGGLVVALFGLVPIAGFAVAGVLFGGFTSWYVGNLIEENALDA